MQISDFFCKQTPKTQNSNFSKLLKTPFLDLKTLVGDLKTITCDLVSGVFSMRFSRVFFGFRPHTAVLFNTRPQNVNFCFWRASKPKTPNSKTPGQGFQNSMLGFSKLQARVLKTSFANSKTPGQGFQNSMLGFSKLQAIVCKTSFPNSKSEFSRLQARGFKTPG